MEPFDTLALGIGLSLVATADGGRHTPLLGGCSRERRFNYRPNWGLPDWPDGEQTAAPVLGFADENVAPGDLTRAVIVPLFPQHVPAWHDIRAEDSLRMYDGTRIHGLGLVRWVERCTWPMPENEQERFADWLRTPPTYASQKPTEPI